MISCNCSCNGIFQGSTPTLLFDTNTPLVDIYLINIVLSQLGYIILDKTHYGGAAILGDLKLGKDIIGEGLEQEANGIAKVDESTLQLTLTQEETLMLSSKYDIDIQLRILYKDGSAVTSETSVLHIHPVLKNEVLHVTNNQ
jgi:hypothetical protein